MLKFFLDSSFIVELLKGNKIAKEINSLLIESEGILLFYNHIVLSEVIYQLHFKRNLRLSLIEEILNEFILLDLNQATKDLALRYMKKYNLKPNDAFILATCKHYSVPNLISLDSDFQVACKKEEIVLINSAEELKRILSLT